MEDTVKKLINSATNAGFRKLLVESGIWKDIYCNIAAKISIVVTIIVSVLIMLVFFNGTMFDLLSSLLPTLIGGMIGLMAFSLSAVAIVTSTISNRFLITLLERNKGKSDAMLKTIRKLIFTFYFSGSLDLLATFILILDLILLYIFISTTVTFIITAIMTLITTYIVSFSLIYSLELIGLCIKLRFLIVDENN
ncbi:MAG: hypothetical protein WBA84_07645 [Carnobacterium sp.]|uniref:hypothetical protein n=1 Tax=Carnobacterium sp. TaxID=48221 RepID=UPI003C759790